MGEANMITDFNSLPLLLHLWTLFLPFVPLVPAGLVTEEEEEVRRRR